MRNVGLIYNYISERKLNMRSKNIEIKLNHKYFTSKTLLYLAMNFKFLKKYKYIPKNVYLNLGRMLFLDKITYLILDAIIYDFLITTKHQLYIDIEVDLQKINNNGFVGTALYNSVKNGRFSRELFIEVYNKEYYSNERFYRRLLKAERLRNDDEFISIVYTDVSSVLKSYCTDEEWVDSVAEIISELLCNVASHTDGDCLVHIDSNNNLLMKDVDNKQYLSINIGIINFSENRLFDKIKENINEKKYNEDDSVYSKIYSAYNEHERYFDDKYDEDDFFFITAFQNHVSSRSLDSSSGGTGLTSLIEKIIGKTEKDYSYVLTGNNIIFFKNEYLGISDEKFIGFNKERDYLHMRPAEEVLSKSELYVPGCAYNLLLIKEW